MKNKKQLAFLVLALLMPVLYHVLNSDWYYLWFNLNLVDALPSDLKGYLLANSFSFDTVFCALLLVVVLPYYLWRRKDLVSNTPQEYVERFTAKSLLPLVVITLGAGGLTAICQLSMRTLLSDVEVVGESVQTFDATFAAASTGHEYFWMFLSIALLGPVIEELIFRGVLFTELNRYCSGLVVVLITSIYFGLWHSNPIQMVYTSVLGLIIGLSYVATRNMWFPMIIHLFNNMLATLPPSLESDETLMLIMVVVKFVAIIPMIVILYKKLKNNPAVTWKFANTSTSN